MIQENIQKVREILNRYTIIDYAFIFGSFLNKPLHESDVDILLGASLTASEQLDLSMELELLLKRKVDIVLVKEASCELVLNAFSKGLPVFIKDKMRLKKDYFRNSYLYDDTITLRQLRISRIKRRFSYA
jgi:predicted nucleotidyltransferase